LRISRGKGEERVEVNKVCNVIYLKLEGRKGEKKSYTGPVMLENNDLEGGNLAGETSAGLENCATAGGQGKLRRRGGEEKKKGGWTQSPFEKKGTPDRLGDPVHHRRRGKKENRVPLART